MIYELRHYVVVPGKGEAVLNRFKNHTFKIFERRGFKVHDFWLEANGSGHLWYVLEWQSAEQMAQPDWNLLGFRRVEKLVDSTRAQSGRASDFANR